MDLSQSECVTTAVPPASHMRTWAAAALGCSKEKTLAMRVVGPAEMMELNSRFAGKHKPTNVLSFPSASTFDELPQECQSELSDEWASLGDIAICADVVASEAAAQGKTLEAHWAHMIVHGVLHLRGYDHIAEEDANVMEAEEIRILASLGFTDPYNHCDGANNHE